MEAELRCARAGGATSKHPKAQSHRVRNFGIKLMAKKDY
jgi:hypothetical protein